MRFKVIRRKKLLRPGQRPELQIQLNLPGYHNVLNALAAIGVAQELGIADAAVVAALRKFQGVGRRLQRYGEVALRRGCSVRLIDDYGHHPEEMRVTLEAVRGAYPNRRLLLAFQPHRFTRTRDLFQRFVRVLSGADALLLADVYAAGEAPIAGADGRALYDAIRRRRKGSTGFVEDIRQLAAAIRRVARPGDVVLTMGAGSIGSVAAELASRRGLRR
jgi:UDP-N-acetylmuramate--alanine ligase